MAVRFRGLRRIRQATGLALMLVQHPPHRPGSYRFDVVLNDDRNSRYMSGPFQLASFEFWNKTIAGQKEQLPRWRQCVRWVLDV
jgi:predicted metalloendopeptidase